MAKILLVEDDKSLREIYGVRLLAEGYDIVSAGDGEEALAMAIKDRPDLILSDVMMPKISGFDMLDILRSTTETRDIKVIMMTALSSDDQRERGEKLGADRYLVKSQVGIEDVVRTVHEVLGDAPTTTTPSFATTRPNAAPSQTQPSQAAPQPTAPPAQPPVSTHPAPAPQPPAAPAAPTPSTPPAAPAPAPEVPPAQPTAPVEPAAAHPAPAAPSLPQPTAPFSSDRPANFGERVVNPPAPSAESADDMSSRIEQELSQALASVSPDMAQPSAPPTTPEASANDLSSAPSATDNTQPPAQ